MTTTEKKSERRQHVALGFAAGKSRRLLAKELNVTEVTIRRDLAHLGLANNDKPLVTRRKKQTAEEKALIALKRRAIRKAPPKEQAEPAKEQPKPPSEPPRAEQLRGLQLPEMIDLVFSWLSERKGDYRRPQNVLDKARNRLLDSEDFYLRNIAESSLSPVELLAKTRPAEIDSAASQGQYRGEEVCALWLARWLANWAPRDKDLRNAVLSQVRDRLEPRPAPPRRLARW